MSTELQDKSVTIPLDRDIDELKPTVGNQLSLTVSLHELRRWCKWKTYFSCHSNEELLTKLLDIIEEYMTNTKLNESPTDRTFKPITGCQNVVLQEYSSPRNQESKAELNINEPSESKTRFFKTSTEQVQQNDKKTSQYSTKESVDEKNLVICRYCDMKHNHEQCPINNPIERILDSVDINSWSDSYKDQRDLGNFTYARLSLPTCLQFSNNSQINGVITKILIKAYTRFGPLIGQKIKEVDVLDDCNMVHIWELQLECGNIYLNTEDCQSSNWMRFVKPAPTRDERNLTVAISDNNLFLVSIKEIQPGDELLYWQDTFSSNNNRKKVDKTVCGGCNMTFSHPLYYKIHCSLFHDIRYSLTIRKYHCKVCGAAVLGKENIRKHATELHNGKGAYQCQYCNKFFLRLSYLEMHRTYGCSSNPLRSKSLCDFCGRKFCQPQKLKIHIKRMHSDLTEVLNDFQCKKCMKLLGSRAALQRHLKEVHDKQQDNSCSCSVCGKYFQNKSNLKIHMLTHSGIKPFKCVMEECTSAFTTKQCLQLHYRKVHNFDEKTMPKIERSVSYTFQAYSGSGKNGNKSRPLEQSEENSENSAANSDIFDSVNLQSPIRVNERTSVSPKNLPLSPSQSLVSLESISKDSSSVKMISKGSRKWITDEILTEPVKNFDSFDTHSHDQTDEHLEEQNITKYSSISEFNRRETSNASLLVEAALDSVCNDASIDIDVEVSHNCSDTLVNNIYNLSDNNVLPEVPYNIQETQDVHLLSPSVNDHISVTDDLDGEMKRHDMDINYGDLEVVRSRSVHTPSSVNKDLNINDRFARTHEENDTYSVQNARRYDFVESINPDQLSSDESNVISIDHDNINVDRNNETEQDLCLQRKTSFKMYDYFKRLRFDDKGPSQQDDNHSSEIEVPDISNQLADKSDKDLGKYDHETATDMRNRFEVDLDNRMRHYENNLDQELNRQRSSYGLCNADLSLRNKSGELLNMPTENRDMVDGDFRTDRHFEPLSLNSDLQGLDMSTRSFHNYSSNINRYHPVYPDLDRMDLRLNYTPPPPYDLVRVVSLDLTPPGRHSVDLSLRSIPLHQIANSRLLTEHSLTNKHRIFDQARLLAGDLTSRINENRLISDSNGRLISDSLGSDRILGTNVTGPEQSSLLTEEPRLLSDHPRIIDQRPLLSESHLLQPTGVGTAASLSAFGSYATVSQTPYPSAMDPRTHVTSPVNTGYHHPYSTYYP
ncbi:hypothetical protein ABEB36_002666 [Hypothenemus hampei]|uniref:PR domain zinc finger protein 4 n=1 Tax=Hypothenemus hampei TaxID=57062 RepID=A0ABD1F971_HYPHA